MMLKRILFYTFLLSLLLSLQVQGSAQQGSYSLSSCEPAVLQIFSPHTWSNSGSWNLEDILSVPPGAQVTWVRLEWEVLSGGGYGGMEVALSNEEEQKEIFFWSNSSTQTFEGACFHQEWEVRFRVSYWEKRGQPLQMTVKKLNIGWEIPAE